MASTAVKDVTKILQAYFANAKCHLPLSESVETPIASSVDKFPQIDDNESQKLHEELLQLYSKEVKKEPQKLSAFLRTLTLLRPWMNGLSRKEEWWTLVVKPILAGIGKEKEDIEHAGEFLFSILNYDSDDDKDGEQAKDSANLTRSLLDIYIRHARSGVDDVDPLSVENEQVARQFEHVLITFGRRKPRDLIVALDKLIVDKECRVRALGLLNTFIQFQPPHLHLVTQTGLIEHLLQCLMIDTSTTVVQLALTALIMFLPHIPTSILIHLPRLFLIYCRLVCWGTTTLAQTVEDVVISDREADETDDLQSPTFNTSDTSWEKLHSAFEGEEPMELELTYYFTFLYGLYPLNFTSFIRKPRRYLKAINFPRAEELDLDQPLIKSRTDQFSQLHLLHANFYNTTVEDELTDNRWLQSDPADVVAECMGLCFTLERDASHPSLSSRSKLPDMPVMDDHNDDTSNTSLLIQEDYYSSLSNDDVPFEPLSNQKLDRSLSRKLSQRSTEKVSKSSAVGSRIGYSPTLPAVLSTTRDTSPTPRSTSGSSHRSFGGTNAILQRNNTLRAHDQDKTYLHRQNILLKNDLSFERYLKQQHLSHIGQLQRRHIADATKSANTEDLINTNRSLNAKLAKANESYASLKRETATGRAQSKKFETELWSKVRTLRDAERTWRAEEENLRSALHKAQNDSVALRTLVVSSEARELLSQQKVASMTLELEQIEQLRTRLRELEEKVRSFEAREIEFRQTADECETLRIGLATADLQLQSKIGETERLKKGFHQRIAELETRMQEVQSQERSPAIQRLLDQTAAAANARVANLKIEYGTLRHQLVELELRYQELENDATEAGVTPSTRYEAFTRHGKMSLRYGSTQPLSRPAPPSDFDAESTSSSGNVAVASPLGAYSEGRGEDTSDNHGSNENQFSADTLHKSNSKSAKEKVTAQTEVRVSEKGGAQNTGKPKKEDENKRSTPRIGGLRGMGIRGFK